MAPTFVHTALMGDPSLRMHPVLPVTNLTLNTTNQGRHVQLSWIKSVDQNITGYQVYKSSARNGNYQLLTTTADSNYTDYTVNNGLNYYMVKAVKLETSFSGTYYNTSIGVMDTISSVIYTGLAEADAAHLFTLYPNPSAGDLMITAQVENAPVTVSLYNINGRKLYEQHWNNVYSTQVLEINTREVANGVYFITCESNGKRTTKKWVLVR